MILKIMGRGFIGCAASPVGARLSTIFPWTVHDFFVYFHDFSVDRRWSPV